VHHSTSLELYSYWIRLKGDRHAPRRCEVEPAAIRTLLSDTFILESEGRTGSSFRLAGTNICSLFGYDLKGTDFLDLWDNHGRETLESSLRILRNDAACISATWICKTKRQHDTDGEFILLPLSHDGRINRILGAFVPLEKPYWHGAFPVASSHLTDIRAILPSEHGLPMVSDRVAPILDTRDIPATLAGRRVRHLTIYEGGQNSG